MSEWIAAVANHLWQTTAFVAAVWVLTLALRKNAARVRYGLWVAASVKFLVPFSVLIALGGMLPRPQRLAAAPAVYSTVDEVALPFDNAMLPRDSVTQAQVSKSRPGAPELVAAGLGAIWLGGVVVVLVVWGMRWRRVWQTLRRARGMESGREFALLQRVQEAMGGQTHVTLRLSRELMEPGIFGTVRPVLIWPEQLSQRLDDEHIAAIVMHELEHVRRRDNLTAALHMLVEAAFWFHPAVWWMERRMVEERERACDEAVVAMGSAPGVYAESLLKAVRFCVESPLTCVAGITGADLSKRVRGIMTLRLAPMNKARKLALGMFALAAIGVPVTFGLVRMIPLGAQILHATGPLPRFEVASIRPWGPAQQMPMQPGAGPRFAPNGEQIISQQTMRIAPDKGAAGQTGSEVRLNVTAGMLIEMAYNLPALSKAQIIGEPDWAGQTMYQLQAKIEDSEYSAMQTMSAAQRKQQVQLMEQSLLAERFGLKVHFETREMPAYALVAAKGGLKLTPAKTEAKPADDAAGGVKPAPTPHRGFDVIGKGQSYEMKASGLSLPAIATFIGQQPEIAGRMVIDQTGLDGSYDFAMRWTREDSATTDAGAATLENAPAFLTALKEQLGLQLVPTKGPVEVIVVDHLEKPSVDGAEVQGTGGADQGTVTRSAAPERSSQPVKPQFEVATVKPANPKGTVIGMFTYPGGRIKCTRCTLQYMTEEAFGMEAWQVAGGPDWVGDAQFDVEAKPSADSAASKLDNPSFKTPPTPEQREMLQSLLADRFQLKFHRESKEGSVYILSRGDKPLKLQPPKDSHAFSWAGSVDGGGIGSVTGMAGTNVSMAELATRLSGFLKLPVIDKTELPGSYDFEYRTGYDDAGADATSAVLASMQGIGLRLKSGKGPVETLVIDHAEMPSEN